MGRVRKKHPREFKIEAVRKLQSGEVSLAELSRRLSVSASELCEWRKQLEEKQGGALTVPVYGYSDSTIVHDESITR